MLIYEPFSASAYEEVLQSMSHINLRRVLFYGTGRPFEPFIPLPRLRLKVCILRLSLSSQF